MTSRSSLAAIAIAVALAGCGGGSSQLSDQDYAKQLTQILKPLQKTLQTDLAPLTSATSRQQITSALGKADDAVQKASSQIDSLDAPDAATDSNAALVTALDTYEKSIADTEEAFRSGTKSQINAQAKAFKADSQSFVNSMKQTASQLKSEGIKVGGAG